MAKKSKREYVWLECKECGSETIARNKCCGRHAEDGAEKILQDANGSIRFIR